MLLQLYSLVLTLSLVESAKILAMFPTPSISHQVVFRTLTKELARRGHEVTVITPDPAYIKDKPPKNLKEIDIHDISYGYVKDAQESYVVTEFTDDLLIRTETIKFMATIFEIQISSPNVKDIVFGKNMQFDLILVEAIVRPAIVLSHIFKAPTILVSSFGGTVELNEVFGASTHPIIYPSSFDKRLYNLSLWERFSYMYNYVTIRSALNAMESWENEILRKHFGPDVPPISELYNNIDMLLVNVHPIWANNQPMPPNVIFMGGIHQLESKELPKELKTYLDSSKNGVIYLSFGTNALAAVIPKKTIEIIAKTLSELPYDILWKWDQDTLPVESSNIKLSKWLPQADLLKHPNIKLFITQAGLQSTDEAITAGVPLVAIPMLGDQWYNAEKYVFHGIGKKLLIEDLNKEVLRDAIEIVIQDKSYRENIIKLREIMRDQPQSPLERSMFWIEHVLKNGGAKHLRAPSANLSWPQYLQMDLLVIFLSVFVLSIVILVIILVYIISIFKKTSIKIKRN